MFNFNDDIVVGFYGVPWLLLLNLLVMFLLILLVYYSTMFVFDITNKDVVDETNKDDVDEVDIKAESSSSSNRSKISFTRICSQHGKVNQESKTIKGIATSNTIRRREVMEIQEEEKLSTTDVTHCSFFSPCHWLELVSKAFLSCLGLHSASQDRSTNKQKNDSSDDISNNSTGPKHQL